MENNLTQQQLKRLKTTTIIRIAIRIKINNDDRTIVDKQLN